MGVSRACLLVVAVAWAAGARGQVGDPPPPPAPIEDPADLDERPPEAPLGEDPADPEDFAKEPSDSDWGDGERLPPPDPPPVKDLPPPIGPAHPAAAAGLGAVGGASGFLAATVAGLGFMVSLQANQPALNELGLLLAGVLAISSVPFLAAAGAGLLIMPFGNPSGPWQYVELCLACAASYVMAWMCVAAAGGGLLGLGLGCNPGSCNPGRGCGSCGRGCGGDPFRGDDTPPDPLRQDVYGAAIGAGVGTILGALGGYFLVGWTQYELGDLPPPELLFVASGIGGSFVGATAGGALGGLIGALSWQDDLDGE